MLLTTVYCFIYSLRYNYVLKYDAVVEILSKKRNTVGGVFFFFLNHITLFATCTSGKYYIDWKDFS